MRHTVSFQWRWATSITDSMDINLSKFQEIVKDRGAWRAAVHAVEKSWTWLNSNNNEPLIIIYTCKYTYRDGKVPLQVKSEILFYRKIQVSLLIPCTEVEQWLTKIEGTLKGGESTRICWEAEVRFLMFPVFIHSAIFTPRTVLIQWQAKPGMLPAFMELRV